MKRRPLLVFAGEFWAGASGAGLSQGLRDLGWAVQEVDYRHYRARSGNDIRLRLASRLTRGPSDDAYRRQLLQECRALRPDIFLTIKGSAISADLLREIKRTGARTVMYYPDFHFDHPGVSEESFKEYDLFVTTKTFQLEHLRTQLGNEHVAYVPHGYVSAVHFPIYEHIAETDFVDDVLYVGSHSGFKQRWLDQLVKAGPEINLRIIGSRWSENTKGGALANKVYEQATEIAYASAIQLAKINIALHFGKTRAGWEDQVSTRSFEIPACRGFMLHIDSDEIREFFDVGAEIDVFSTPEELAEKIRFYLPRSDLRHAMMERAYNRCVSAYSYQARAKAIADLLAERLDKRRDQQCS